MKRLICLTAVIAVMFFGASFAKAAVWTDIHDPANFKISYVFLNPVASTYYYQHDIRDNGFSPFSDFVNDYSVEIFLYDDSDTALERAYISIPLPLIPGGSYNFSYTSNTFDASFLGLIELNLFGLLDVYVTATRGDFYFDKSILTARGVPEPGTLLLLGSGLVGMALLRRRMLK